MRRRRDLPVDLTIITSTIEGRELELARCNRSIDANTRPPECRIWRVNQRDHTMMSSYNRMAAMVDTTWLFRLDDDDELEPHHFEVLGDALDDEHAVIYTWCHLEAPGRPPDLLQRPFDPDALRVGNYVPAPAAIRVELWRELGGYVDPNPSWAFEDWHFWLRALRAGARFKCVPEVTWRYSPAWGS